jgi:hypothetical protein
LTYTIKDNTHPDSISLVGVKINTTIPPNIEVRRHHN